MSKSNRGPASGGKKSLAQAVREREAAKQRAEMLAQAAFQMLEKPRGAALAPTAKEAIRHAAQSALDASRLSEIDADKTNHASDRIEELLAEHLGYRPKSVAREYAESIGVALLIALFIRGFLVEAFKIPTGSMIPTLEINDHIFVNKASYGLRIPFVGKYAFQWSKPQRGDVVVFEFPGKGEDQGTDYIKRIVAVPGDRIRMESNRLIVNGEPVPSTVTKSGVECRNNIGKTIGGGFLAGCGVGEAAPPDLYDRCPCDVVEERVGDTIYLTQHRLGGGICASLKDWPNELPLRVDTSGEYFGSANTNPHWPDVIIPEGHVFTMGDNRDNSRDGRFWGVVPMDKIKGRAFIRWWATDKSRIFERVK